jgi:hypothetical protein
MGMKYRVFQLKQEILMIWCIILQWYFLYIRAVCVPECNNTDSIGLSQLLDEMAKPSEGLSQSSSQDVEEKSTKCTGII